MTPTESRRLASLIQTFSPRQKVDFYYFTIVENQDPMTFISNMEKAQVKVDAMIQAALTKASFGGDRSAAGRYAAEQRWKNHQEKEPKTEPRVLSQKDTLDIHEDMMGRQEKVIKEADIPNEAERAYQLYPTSAHAAMNQVLRGQEVEGMWVSETIRPEVAAKALKENFDKMAIETPEPLVLYRGIPSGELVLGVIEGGTEFEDAGLISTSLSADFARSFGDGGDVDIIFTITVPKGTKVLVPKGPYWKDEREVVLRPDTKFRVKEVVYSDGEYGETAEVICEVVNE